MKKFTAFICTLAFMGSTLGFSHELALSQWIYQIRDPETNSKDFRDSLEKIGEYLSLEVLKDLKTKEVSVETLTAATATHDLCDEQPVLVTILRAGIPTCVGVQKVFPHSEVGFIGMARNEETLIPKTDYIALPSLRDKTVLIVDTMLATAGSALEAVKIVEKHNPRKILILCAIAAEPGIARVLDHNPQIKIYPGVVDPVLNEKGYIVPGLGDAGDRAYGKKE